MEAQAISYFLAVFQLHFQVIVVVVAVVSGGGGVIDTGRVEIFPNRAIHSFIHSFLYMRPSTMPKKLLTTLKGCSGVI